MRKHIKMFNENKMVQDALAAKQKEVRLKQKADREKYLAEQMKNVSGGSATVAEVNNQETGKIDLEEGARRAGVIPEENKGQA